MVKKACEAIRKCNPEMCIYTDFSSEVGAWMCVTVGGVNAAWYLLYNLL